LISAFSSKLLSLVEIDQRLASNLWLRKSSIDQWNNIVVLVRFLSFLLAIPVIALRYKEIVERLSTIGLDTPCLLLLHLFTPFACVELSYFIIILVLACVFNIFHLFVKVTFHGLVCHLGEFTVLQLLTSSS